MPVLVRSTLLSSVPSTNDEAALQNNLAVLVSRLLVNQIDFFKFSFDAVVDWNMSSKSKCQSIF